MSKSISMESLLALTRKAINEYISTEDDFSEETNALLKTHIITAAKQIAAAAPDNIVEIDQIDSTLTTQRPDGMYYTETTIPSDCLRILDVYSDHWKRPVVDILPLNHPNLGREYTSVKGLGSGPNNPHAYRMRDVLFAHAMSDSNAGSVTDYVKCPAYNPTDNLIDHIAEEAKEAIAYQAAALYLGSTGDQNATAAQAAATALVQSWIAGDAMFIPKNLPDNPNSVNVNS